MIYLPDLCSGSAEEVKGRIIIPSLAFQRSRSNPTTLKHTATSCKDYTVGIDPLPCFASATTTQLEKNYKTRFVSGSSTFLPERAQVRPTRLPQQQHRYESYFSEEHKTTKVFDLDACLLAAGIESSGEEKVKSSTAAAGSLVDIGTGMFLPLTPS